MFHYVKTHSFNNRCRNKDTNTQDVHEFTNGTEEYCFIELPNNKTTIIDKKYMEDVMKYNWFKNQCGYIMHQRRCKETEIETSQLALHLLIKKLQMNDPNFNIEKHVTSIDHINRQPYDNRESNLRVATNSEQNSNQKIRSDRNKPIEDLVKIGITEYPRHIRFDNSQERFVIETSHPELQKEKKRLNGTRKGTLIQKYFDILHIGLDLDKSWLRNKTDSTFEGNQISERHKCIELVTSLNNHLNKCVVSIDSIYDAFANASSYKKQIDHMLTMDLKLDDPNVVHEENGFVLTKSMVKQLPKHMYFQPPKKNRGCYFEYDFRDKENNVRNTTRLSSSVKVSLEDKYKKAMEFEYPVV